MTIEQRISDWMKDREDELVEALRPLIEAESTLGEAKPGMPFGEGPALALDRGLELGYGPLSIGQRRGPDLWPGH